MIDWLIDWSPWQPHPLVTWSYQTAGTVLPLLLTSDLVWDRRSWDKTGLRPKKNRSWSWSCRSRVLLRNTGLVTLVEHNDLEGHSNVSSTIDFFNSLSILCLDHHYCGDQQWRLKVKSAKCYCLLLVVLVVHNAAVLVLRIWSCLHHCYYHYYYYYYYSNDTTNNNKLSMRPPQYDPAPASVDLNTHPQRPGDLDFWPLDLGTGVDLCTPFLYQVWSLSVSCFRRYGAFSV